MDLFHLQRYWSDDEEKADPSNQEKEILASLKGKAKKRKISETGPKPEAEDGGQDTEKAESESPKKKKKKKKKSKKNNADVAKDFEVLGENVQLKKKQIKRILPEWLTNPDVISVDVNENQLAVSDMKGLDDDIKNVLSVSFNP